MGTALLRQQAALSCGPAGRTPTNQTSCASSLVQVVGGKDLSARVFSLNPIEGYRPPTLAGHREPIVAGAQPCCWSATAAVWWRRLGCCGRRAVETGVLLTGEAGAQPVLMCAEPQPAADGSPPACPACPAVHFTTAKLQESAGLIGKEAPHVYTLSKDGALHAWTYRKPDEAAEAAAAAEREAEEAEEAAAGRKRRRAEGEEEGASSEDEGSGDSGSEEDEEGGSSSSEEEEEASSEEEGEQRGQQGQLRQQAAVQPPAAPEQSRTFAGGHWKLTEKHYFNQRGAKLSAADFQVGGGMPCVGGNWQARGVGNGPCSAGMAYAHKHKAAGCALAGTPQAARACSPPAAVEHHLPPSPLASTGRRGPAGRGLQQRHL